MTGKSDLQMLAELGLAPGKGASVPWRLFCRQGRILLVLPEGGAAIRSGLRLYRPQRALAKMMVRALAGFPPARVLLKCWEAEILAGGPLEKILAERGATLRGILLGNPGQSERRAILLLEREEGSWCVVKLGTSPEADTKIRKEREFLDAHAYGRTEIPELRGRWDGEGWSAFAIDYCAGEGSPAEEILAKILRSWSEDGERFAAGDFAAWKTMADGIEDQAERDAMISEGTRLRLAKSLRHGDFTPWNFLERNDGGPMVIDWEFGESGSVPGWDLVHFLYFSAILVERLAAPEAIRSVRGKLEESAHFTSLLKHLGWRGETELLMKSYFFAMKGQLENYRELAEWV